MSFLTSANSQKQDRRIRCNNMDFTSKIKSLSDNDFFRKLKTHEISNTFLIFCWLVIFVLSRTLSADRCGESAESPSLHGCGGTPILLVAGFIAVALLLPSCLEAANGLKLVKTAKERFPQNRYRLLQITSYLLLVPICWLIIFYYINVK